MQKVNKIPSQQTSWAVVVHACKPSYAGAKAGSGQKCEFCLKNNQSKNG
jgi:hypothetical protein